MNKPTITLTGSRGEEWERVLGTRTLAIHHPEYSEVSLGGTPNDPNVRNGVHVVFLDVDELTREQQDRLIEHMALKFGVPREEAAADVLGRGVPIRLGEDARIELPPGYKAPQKKRDLLCGPNAWDLRFFT